MSTAVWVWCARRRRYHSLRDYRAGDAVLAMRWRHLHAEVDELAGVRAEDVHAEDHLGLYPIVTLQYSSATLYQVSYYIR